MQLNEFAEQILFGSTLADKLVWSDFLEDHPPAKSITKFPDFPARPPELSLNRHADTPRITFPSLNSLEHEQQRGIVLHFFANHELLALELMALMLLKFPQAPSAFRKGLAHTMHEEQEHMRLYERRMEECGVGFGEIPVNDFFWKCISQVSTLQEFVAQMSLTFEQANLDYSLYYAQAFQKIGDQITAGILEQVFQDEIGHVQHGLKWFRKWKQPYETDWEAYQTALTFPITPARAKGIGFNETLRKEIGFSEGYVSELALYSYSKGRPPDIYWFNPACEMQVALGNTGYTPPESIRAMTNDLSSLPMLLCSQDDVVITPYKPSSPFLHRLRQAGFPLPEFSTDISCMEHRKIRGFHPWGWSPNAAKRFAPLVPQLLNESNRGPFLGSPDFKWNPKFRRFFSKAWSVEQGNQLFDDSSLDPHWNCDQEVEGVVCCTPEEVDIALRKFETKGWTELLIKAAFSASGQHRMKVSDQFSVNPKWLANILQKQGSVVVEPWLDKVCDFSTQFRILEDGRCVMDGVNRFLTDFSGQYLGAVLGRFDTGLDSDTLKFLHYHPDSSQPKPLFPWLESIGKRVGKEMIEVGYRGAIGIDWLVYRDSRKIKQAECKKEQKTQEVLAIKPIVEINSRYTMGRLALSITSHLQHGRVGLWLFFNRKHVVEAGFSSLEQFADRLQQSYPIEIVTTPLRKIRQGALCTNDPSQAKSVLSVVLVAHSLQECREVLNDISPVFCRWTDTQ